MARKEFLFRVTSAGRRELSSFESSQKMGGKGFSRLRGRACVGVLGGAAGACGCAGWHLPTSLCLVFKTEFLSLDWTFLVSFHLQPAFGLVRLNLDVWTLTSWERQLTHILRRDGKTWLVLNNSWLCWICTAAVSKAYLKVFALF